MLTTGRAGAGAGRLGAELAEIYSWFTEGFATADPKDTKTFLYGTREDR